MKWDLFEDIALLQSDSYEVGLTYYAREQVAWLLNGEEVIAPTSYRPLVLSSFCLVPRERNEYFS